MEVVDLSFQVETGMPTCGTPWHQSVEVSPMGTLSTVGRNTHRIVVGSHSGTHMDAPYHFIENGKTIESLDLNIACGPVNLVDFRQKGEGAVVTSADVKDIKVSKRMLFVFGWFHRWKTQDYYRNFPFFSLDAVEYLISKGMQFMAMDTPSPDNGSAITDRESDSPNHKLLLKNNVIIVEYLNNTDKLDFSMNYEIFALPLAVIGSDGSPARVIVRELS